MRDDLVEMTASEAAALIRAGELSSEALVQACLDRISEREPDVRAWAHLDPNHALEQAREADVLRKEGRGVGPLHGVPVGLKDIIDTAELPTERGSAIFAGRRAEKDAGCVTQLRNAGAVVLGKTVTTELASLPPGKTRNPVNPVHTPGGSSSGSAAAVACGMVPVALGTQTAGSVIRPASFCGAFGFKPTFGLISRRGVLMQSHTLDTLGVFGRSVADLALLADCLSARDPDDAGSYPRSQPSLHATATAQAPLPPLFAFLKTPAWDQADAVTREAFAELAETLGAQCVELELPSLETAISAQRTVMGAENGAYYGLLLARGRDKLSPGMIDRIEAGQRVPAHEYIRAVGHRETIYASIEEILRDYTAILTPAARGPAPPTLEHTGDPIFNGMWTYLGVPAVSLPLLEADGLPIGVQLVGLRRDDGRLLRTARWLAEHVRQSE